MKSYNELEFTDNFMFVNILTREKELCKELLEVILQRKIRDISFVDCEKSLKPKRESRGIRMDVYTESDDGEIFDVEMQARDEEYHPKRCRYYHSVIDVDQVESGGDFSELKKTYVIFICKSWKNAKSDKPIHRYSSINEEDINDRLDDEEYTVIVNAACDDKNLSPELRGLLEYVRTGKVSGDTDSLAYRLDAAVRDAVSSGRWSTEYMYWSDELKHIGFLEHKKGVDEGIAQEHVNTEKERQRAEAAEKEVAELKAKLALLEK